MYPNYGPVFGNGIPVMPKAKNTQPLTAEQISQLRNRSDAIKIEVSQDDLLRAACTHKEADGNMAIRQVGETEDGRPIVECSICGKQFAVTEAEEWQVKYAVDLIENLLQTVKLFYVDAPENLIVQYFQMLPLLEQFEKLYNRAIKNFSQYEKALDNNNNIMPGVASSNGFQILGSMLTNPYGFVTPQPGAIPPQGYPQQPPVAPPPIGFAQPSYPPYPPTYPPTGQPAPAYDPYRGSPIMAPTNHVAPVPQTPPSTSTPGSSVASAPAPTGQAEEVTQTKQFNV